MNWDLAKKNAAIAAAKEIKSGMLIGIGTGSTVFYFIEELIKLTHEGLNIKAVSSSSLSSSQAQKGGILFERMDQVEQIDITIDGADEIDPAQRMIKGGGGALLREKIIASCSKKVIIIVDSSKVVTQLGKQKLPVEILPFGYKATIFHINKLGYHGKLRLDQEEKLLITDNGNFIFDIYYPCLITNPEKDHHQLKEIPGVVETGFFFNLVNTLYVGNLDGSVTRK